MRPFTLITIGAGGRGTTYSAYTQDHPDQFKIVGVAEPHDVRRERFKLQYNLTDENTLTTWEHVFTRDKWADAVIISTQDNMHYGPAMAAIEKGYDILLEKPISPSEEECFEIARAAEAAGVKVIVCHTMRYSPMFEKIKEILDSGAIGEIVTFAHNENVGDLHYSHSFNRGHWRNTAESSPMILAKSCHDLDILQWLIGKKCVSVSSYGSLKYFNEANKPPDAPPRCTDGCPVDCPYDTRKLYMDRNHHHMQWFASTAVGFNNPTDEEVLHAMQTGRYGKCVFQCDNDVVDNQVVNMLFEGDTTVMFSMCAFTPDMSRSLKIMGTKGELKAHTSHNDIKVYDFITREEKIYNPDHREGGHGGGDTGIMMSFYEYLCGNADMNKISEAGISAQNHRLCFAAEESRLNSGKVVLV